MLFGKCMVHTNAFQRKVNLLEVHSHSPIQSLIYLLNKFHFKDFLKTDKDIFIVLSVTLNPHLMTYADHTEAGNFKFVLFSL